MKFKNIYFIIGNAYAGKSTMINLLAKKYNGILCEENYHNKVLNELDANDFPALTYTRDLKDWREFIRRTPKQSAGVCRKCVYVPYSFENKIQSMLGEKKDKPICEYCHFVFFWRCLCWICLFFVAMEKKLK